MKRQLVTKLDRERIAYQKRKRKDDKHRFPCGQSYRRAVRTQGRKSKRWQKMKVQEQGLVVFIWNLSTWKHEAGWLTSVQGQTKLQCESLAQKTENRDSNKMKCRKKGNERKEIKLLGRKEEETGKRKRSGEEEEEQLSELSQEAFTTGQW